MKYLLPFLFVLFIFMGCKKNSQTCWKCTLGAPPAPTACPKMKMVCSDDGTLPSDATVDCNGNDYGGNCIKQ